MRLVELHLKAFGPFTDQVLPLGNADQRLVLVHGLNEAGKSSAMRAMKALRFGVPVRTTDNFLHDYAHLRVGGVLLDAAGQRHALMRRKGSGQTLRFFDPGAPGAERPDAVPAPLLQALHAGLSEADYQTLFGLDHATLRAGGAALARGEGEIGAALFEASAGVADVSRMLTELDATARRFYLPSAAGRNARINQGLAEYKLQAERHRDALVRPVKWEAVHRASQLAHEALAAAEAAHARIAAEHLAARELIAVAPLLATLVHANGVLASLVDIPLLAENAAAERSAAQAGLTEAEADIRSAEDAAAMHRGTLAGTALDTAALAVAPAIARLNASSATLAQLLAQQATATADEARAAHELASVAAALAPGMDPDTLHRQAPGPAVRARLEEAMAALDEAGRALAQHREQAPEAGASALSELRPLPEPHYQSAVRAALADVSRHEPDLQRLAQWPAAMAADARLVRSRLDAVGLPDAAAAQRARPLLAAEIDEAQRLSADLAAQRAQQQQRIADTRHAQDEARRAIDTLLAQGPVPSHEDVQGARLRRDAEWHALRGPLLGTAPMPADGAAQSASYELTVQRADQLADQVSRDSERVARLAAARQQAAALEAELARREGELVRIEAAAMAADARWAERLGAAGLPHHSAAVLRDWQLRLAAALQALDDQTAHHAEAEALEGLAERLVQQLRDALEQLGLSPVDGTASLGRLRALAEQDLVQVEALAAARNHAAGQAQQLQRLAEQHASRARELEAAFADARAAFAAEADVLRLAGDASLAVARARLAEFDRLAAAAAARDQARLRAQGHASALAVHDAAAASIAAALGEPPPADVVLAAELWSARAARARTQQDAADRAAQRLAGAEDAVTAHRAKAARHRATLMRLCRDAGVDSATDLPEAEERSARKREAERDATAAARALAQASRRSTTELARALDGRDAQALNAEELRLEQALVESNARMAQARREDEAARRELDAIDAADTAAAAADAMARAEAGVRQALPLQRRSRLAHALLQEAVRRFKERSQGPMLSSASRHFARLTGGEFDGLQHDDTDAATVIVARRPSGATVGMDALSEGTRDQLYLALRLAALELQRARGIDLPVILDDVLMTSDDRRATHILQALAEFASGGQVIVFTHHAHLCDVARQAVGPDRLAIVELRRT
ncbi:AAA family ATPase [Rhizobacter sp. LjRoot28]|uniref:ATP-binding protein n=1 Tax=Rhizobacter sp. LjRoot28 TaxID=3342309 RepID=UPI003ECC9296